MEDSKIRSNNPLIKLLKFYAQHGISLPGEVLVIGFVCFGLPLILVVGIWLGESQVESLVHHPMFLAWVTLSGASVKLSEMGIKPRW